MEDPVFRVYVAQTKSVFDELDFLDFEEIGFANIAVDRILKKAANDARSQNLKEQYSDRVGNITVAARARLSGTKIYIVLVRVGSDGDWDPDGCDGLDHIAFSQNHEIAKAFVTFIGGRPTFRWIKRRPRKWRNENITDSTIDLLKPVDSVRIQDLQTFRFAWPSCSSLLFGSETNAEIMVGAKTPIALFGSGATALVIREGTTCTQLAGESQRAQHAWCREAFDLSGSRAEVPGTASADASRRSILGISLPQGSELMEFGSGSLFEMWSAHRPGDSMEPDLLSQSQIQ